MRLVADRLLEVALAALVVGALLTAFSLLVSGQLTLRILATVPMAVTMGFLVGTQALADIVWVLFPFLNVILLAALIWAATSISQRGKRMSVLIGAFVAHLLALSGMFFAMGVSS